MSDNNPLHPDGTHSGQQGKPRAVRKVASTDPEPLPVGQLPYVAKETAGRTTTSESTSEPATTTGQSPAAPLVVKTSEPRPAFAGDIIDDEPETDETPQGGPADNGDEMTTSGTEPHPSKPAYRGRTGTDSANLRQLRDVEPRADLITFTDEPGQKKFTNRRKRTRLNKGGMFFNARDREIVLLVAAHGWLDREQLANLIGGVSTDSLRHSLKRLVTHRLLEDRYIGFGNQILYTVTALGLRKTGAEGFNSGVVPRIQTVEHTDAITALHIYMVKNARAGAIFMTERELYAAASSGVMTPRILAAAPWAEQYGEFPKWIPRTVTDKGKPMSKRPDGLLLSVKDGKAQPPIAVEIERTIKSRPGYYTDALIMFANAAKDGWLAPAVTYFAPTYDGTAAKLETELKAVYSANADVKWPAALPRIRTEVNDLDTFYIPYSATRGWFPRTANDPNTDG